MKILILFIILIIGKNEEGYWKRPYLLTYVMGEEFRPKYDATGSTEGFTGRLLKRYISPSTSDSRRGGANYYDDPYTSNDPCDRETEVVSVGSGGGDDPYTEFEAPTPGMGNTFCYTYWYYFETSTICGNDGYFTDCEMGVRRPFLVTECIEYGGSMAGSDPCDQDKEEVAIIDPEANELDCSTFENRVENILKSEGGFVNNPDDKGGATNRGIAWNTWKENALKILGKEPTLDNLKNLSEADAKKIYKAKYWSKSGGENINDGDTRYFMFDFTSMLVETQLRFYKRH
ncbi:glycosyl hydrolase 108 family protein [Roseivirga seohaensis]|uniref:glycosyl hydrolase 108 family protein n=1 Tax=Roseivirga seohaensis TaxID=1914963 RepID=UPI00069F33EA|nr:glycosyl hydrolase 108 family protein [Roseivirga seohaensis]